MIVVLHQLLERGACAVVRREHLQHGAVARDRSVRIRQLDLDELGGAEREIRAIARVRRE